MLKLLGLLVGGFVAAICGLVLLVLSVIAAMPWLGAGVTGGPSVLHIAIPAPLPAPAPAPSAPIQVPAGFLSAADRYQLALDIGFNPAEALIATAISLCEDPSGDPRIESGRNKDGSFDIGIMQVNSGRADEFGGVEALKDPVTNMRAALVIYGRQGWFGWCTFPGGCGGLPGSPFWPQALAQATAIARAAGN